MDLTRVYTLAEYTDQDSSKDPATFRLTAAKNRQRHRNKPPAAQLHLARETQSTRPAVTGGCLFVGVPGDDPQPMQLQLSGISERL